MLKRILLAAIAIVTLVTVPAVASTGPQFSFAPPAGWRLDPGPGETKKTYWLRTTTRKDPRCSLGLGAEQVSSLAAAQDASLSRLRATLTGPSAPRIVRSTLRSRSGVKILKADVRFDGYSQPQYRRGAVFPLRCIYYSFQVHGDTRIYSLECWPEVRYGSYFDGALDDLSRTISL